MPIDLETAKKARLPERPHTWTADDVILYHLAIGAGSRSTEVSDLAYTYEEGLRVIPTYAVLPAVPFLAKLDEVPGFDFDPAMTLHGEHELELHQSPDVSGSVMTSARITDVFDKEKGALILGETSSRDAAERLLFVNRFSAFILGEGGFGGDAGPSATNHPPDRDPDWQVMRPTIGQQGLLYRLTGDKNPLHVDPAFARRVGFARPILHGLCTYGIVCKAAIDQALDGRAENVARYKARFAGTVFPGETIIVRGWREEEQILLQASTAERGAEVITNAVLTLRESAHAS